MRTSPARGPRSGGASRRLWTRSSRWHPDSGQCRSGTTFRSFPQRLPPVREPGSGRTPPTGRIAKASSRELAEAVAGRHVVTERRVVEVVVDADRTATVDDAAAGCEPAHADTDVE